MRLGSKNLTKEIVSNKDMKNLLFIMFFPLYLHAQMGAGIAYYDGVRAPQFSVLVNSSTLTNSQKASVARDTLNCYWVRSAVTTSTWTGSSNRIEAYIAKGLAQYMVVNYSTGSPAPFVTSAQVAGYKDTLGKILAKYPYPKIVGIVVNNEEQNTNFNSGSMTDYVNNELIPAYQVAHPLGILVMDGGMIAGGLDIKTLRYVDSVYGTTTGTVYATAAGMSAAQINAARNPGSNPTLDAKANQIDTILSARNYVDYFNIHSYQPSITTTQPDTVTQSQTIVYQRQKEMVEYYSHKPCISNEVGTRNNTLTTLVTNQWNGFVRLGFFMISLFDGNGSDGAVTYTDETTGAILPNGTAFKTVITANQNNQPPLLP